MNIFHPFGELQLILPNIAFTDKNRKCQATFVRLQHVAFKAGQQIFHGINSLWYIVSTILKFFSKYANHRAMESYCSQWYLNKSHNASKKFFKSLQARFNRY
ncbi:hypothetical protein AF54_04256 [Serratia marcescens BIDMC 81]|nr:hypothetical protein AF54_04256 [Serratia marcescens BIDMC 81]